MSNPLQPEDMLVQKDKRLRIVEPRKTNRTSHTSSLQVPLYMFGQGDKNPRTVELWLARMQEFGMSSYLHRPRILVP